MISRERFCFSDNENDWWIDGEPVTIHQTREAMPWELAATWRGYSWAGIDIGDTQGRFWGVPLGKKDNIRVKLMDFIANRKRCSAFSFSERDLDRYTSMLRKFSPRYFYGYVSMIEDYAKYFRRHGITPPFKLACIVTTSEVLTEYQRRLIQDVFSTRVFNDYGSGELGSEAHECKHRIPSIERGEYGC